jgi:hypothetical protein
VDAGSNLAGLFDNLNRLHERVGSSFPDLHPPSFEVVAMDATGMSVRYVSNRSGLMSFVAQACSRVWVIAAVRFDRHRSCAWVFCRGRFRPNFFPSALRCCVLIEVRPSLCSSARGNSQVTFL